MKNRSVSKILFAQIVDMGGFPVRQPLPSSSVTQVDPFLLIHHADVKVPDQFDPMKAGIGPHPHRGFSPVTFIFKGGVFHRDSLGNSSIVEAGGAQWMNAGRGVIHSERPPENIHALGGRQEIIQLWINTPARLKMEAPSYFPVKAGDVASFTDESNLVTINVFSGELNGLKGPVPLLFPVNSATLSFRKGGRISLPVPHHHNVLVYLLDGKLDVEGYGPVDGLNLVLFQNDGEGITMEAIEDTRILLLTGEPLKEPVVSYGPFVVTSRQEILNAMEDYQEGRMGSLIEE